MSKNFPISNKKITFLIVSFFLTTTLGAIFFMTRDKNSKLSFERVPESVGIRYVAIGDSYTIGEGVATDSTWPALLTKHLNDEGIFIQLVANPSRSGWTSRDALEREMPIYRASKPEFATVLIGANDWVQGVDAVTFRANFSQLLDEMQLELDNPKNIIVITIPDFSATPSGARFGGERNISQGIAEFNEIITAEAQKRGLKVVDIFPVSQKMKGRDEAVISDGLHPSAQEYEVWEELIYPEAVGLLKKIE